MSEHLPSSAWLWGVFLGGAVLGSVLWWHGRRLLADYRGRVEAQLAGGLADAFLFVGAARLRVVLLALATAVLLLGFLLQGSGLALALLAAVAVLGPRLLLARLRTTRRHRLRAQLPDAILLVAGALRAGSGLAAAFDAMARDTRAPMSQEIDLLLREHRLGATLVASLDALARRLDIEELTLLRSAVAVSSETGGNLAEALERLAETLRTRLVVEGRIAALTAQGRLQAWVMGAMPPALLLVLAWIDPQGMAPLATHPAGWAACLLVLALDVLGVAWIRRLLAIRT